jgi:hypothetical protein
MSYNPNGTGEMSIPALSYIDMSGGVITVTSDLNIAGDEHLSGDLYGIGGTIHVGDDFAAPSNRITAANIQAGNGPPSSASVAGTTAHFTSSAGVDGTLAVGGLLSANGGVSVQAGNSYAQLGTATNNINGPVVVGTTSVGANLTVHGQIITSNGPNIYGVTFLPGQSISGTWPLSGSPSANTLAVACNDLHDMLIQSGISN